MRDCLTIAYDNSDEDEDESYLLVSRNDPEKVNVINEYRGEAADELYKILIGE